VATDVQTGGTERETRPDARPGFFARMIQFFADVRNELRKVTWPTFDELKKSTTVIIIFVAILGFAIGLMDSAFQFVFVKAVAKLF
jgi:preprotein translocase subunit SecE